MQDRPAYIRKEQIMSTVLVPLDETAFAESILPDAEQLAGPDGRLLFVYVAARDGRASDVERYLSNEAQLLKARNYQVESRVLVGGDIPRAIDEGVTALGAEMVAVATHGVPHRGRLARSSVAWKTLAHSPVPILFRHAQPGRVRELDESGPQPVTIMVPLDGSPTAEQALPLAASLAAQWQGSLLLVQIGSEVAGGQAHLNEISGNLTVPAVDFEVLGDGVDPTGGKAYLDRLSQGLTVPVHTALGHGRAGEALARLAGEHAVTHVVMTSHGRTGLSRVLAGDVAADLIERLSLPIIVVPSLIESAHRSSDEMAAAPAGLSTPS
jgi:nucleotide-binding universal stress UspA family protein